MSFRNRNSGRALLPFGLDYSDVMSSNYETEKPELVLPVNGPLTHEEESEAKQAISFAKLMVDGPFYTGTIQDAINADDKSKGAQKVSASSEIQRYSDRYKKVKKIGRTIEEHPYQLELFPGELYAVMGVSNKQKKKLLSLSTFKSDGGLRKYNLANAEENEEENAQSMLEKLKTLAEELDNGNENKEDAEEEDIEEDMDDDFDEDDDDDYNAEKYFDDGDEDVVDAGDDEAAF